MDCYTVTINELESVTTRYKFKSMMRGKYPILPLFQFMHSILIAYILFKLIWYPIFLEEFIFLPYLKKCTRTLRTYIGSYHLFHDPISKMYEGPHSCLFITEVTCFLLLFC